MNRLRKNAFSLIDNLAELKWLTNHHLEKFKRRFIIIDILILLTINNYKYFY